MKKFLFVLGLLLALGVAGALAQSMVWTYTESRTYTIHGSTNIVLTSQYTRPPVLASAVLSFATPVANTFGLSYSRDGVTNNVFSVTNYTAKTCLVMLDGDVMLKTADTIQINCANAATAQLTLNWR